MQTANNGGAETHHGSGGAERARGNGPPDVADGAAVDQTDAAGRLDSENTGHLEHEERRGCALGIEDERASESDVGGGPAIDALQCEQASDRDEMSLQCGM